MEYRVGLRPNRPTVVEDDSHGSSWERMLGLLGSFVPGNESAWERNVLVVVPFDTL